MMDPTRVTYPWKMLFWLFLLIAAAVVITNLCYAQSPTLSLPGTMPNHVAPGSVGGPVMVIPPTFIYPVAPAPTPAPAAPVMIIPPTGLPTFVYPGVSR